MGLLFAQNTTKSWSRTLHSTNMLGSKSTLTLDGVIAGSLTFHFDDLYLFPCILKSQLLSPLIVFASSGLQRSPRVSYLRYVEINDLASSVLVGKGFRDAASCLQKPQLLYSIWGVLPLWHCMIGSPKLWFTVMRWSRSFQSFDSNQMYERTLISEFHLLVDEGMLTLRII